MWDKREGKPKYDQRDENSWIGHYIVKKSNKERYYLTSLNGRKMPLPVDVFILQPYVQFR
jgi:hypothetical protein